ncbi:DUF4312 family protein [Hafnia paralvei]|nr:DUF4312 family protein [Hafnia paralvei]
MKDNITTTVTVSGRSDTKQKAFAAALSSIQGTLLRESKKVFLRIEPVDIKVVKAEEKITMDKFLFFFLPRKKYLYSITLDVTVNMTTVDTDKIEFKSVNTLNHSKCSNKINSAYEGGNFANGTDQLQK